MTVLRNGVVVLGLTLAIPAVAQMDLTEVATKVSQARQANPQKAHDDSWTQRIEVKVKGETNCLETAILRSTVDGGPQKTPIDETSAKKPRGVRGMDDDA